MRTVCFSVNNDSVFQCEQCEQSVSVLIMRTVCFSVNNEDSVFQCEQWEQSVSVVTHMNAFPSSKTLIL